MIQVTALLFRNPTDGAVPWPTTVRLTSAELYRIHKGEALQVDFGIVTALATWYANPVPHLTDTHGHHWIIDCGGDGTPPPKGAFRLFGWADL